MAERGRATRKEVAASRPLRFRPCDAGDGSSGRPLAQESHLRHRDPARAFNAHCDADAFAIPMNRRHERRSTGMALASVMPESHPVRILNEPDPKSRISGHTLIVDLEKEPPLARVYPES